ncbi:MAG: hypothetical protein M3Y52_09260 [Actinomycetota bacterium]|nr:hypothetical protein [Actinomycetota bacterium]
MDSVESRIRVLQRIAYGADATDAERERAVAELEALRAGPAGGARPDSGGVSGSDLTGFDPPDAAGTTSPAAPAMGESVAQWPRRAAVILQSALVAASIGAVVGGAIGWGIGQRVLGESTSTSSSTSTAASGDSRSSGAGGTAPVVDGMPIESTDLLPLMGRLPTADEAARVARLDPPMDPESVGLLASRTDGPTAFLARTVDGGDLCLVVLMPSGPSRSACTVVGRFPVGGLRIEYYADGYGLVAAHLDDSGAVELNLSVPF